MVILFIVETAWEIARRLPQILFKFLFGFVQIIYRPLNPERFLGLLLAGKMISTSFMFDAFLDVSIPVLLNLSSPLDRDVFSLVQPYVRLILVNILKCPQLLPMFHELLLKLLLLLPQGAQRNSCSSALLCLLSPDDILR